MRKSDKQVRDKEGIPRISRSRFRLTGERGVTPEGVTPTNEAISSGRAITPFVFRYRPFFREKETITSIHNEEFDPGSG